MVKILIGNIFESEMKTLVNTVNCVGIMGKGVAQEFKKRFPEMFKDYSQQCKNNQVQPGVPYLYQDLFGTSILNFPTKDHWRSPSKLEDIIRGLDIFVENYKEWGIKSIAFPPLGCGNGGLEWEVVGPIMYQKLAPLDIDIEIYAPFGTPKTQLNSDFLKKEVPLGQKQVRGRARKSLPVEWVVLLEVLYQLERQPYANPVGRTIFQKICYTMTEQGINTGFKFKQGNYGPFSSEVKEAMNVFANANLIAEEQLGAMHSLKVGSEYCKVRERFKHDIQLHKNKILKTTDLFSRIKSTEQAEEVTTVFYAVRQLKLSQPEKDVSEEDVYEYILSWKKRWDNEQKKEAIASAIRNLTMLSWMKVKFSDSLPLAEIYS